ncbi:MAG: response regulator transcription factor [Dehalococcoidales bacterium]|nr:response regulator transcription factor [Dehalococcoidales bacterium]
MKIRILVADDEINILRFLRAHLEAGGYEVFTAIDGTEAIEKIDLQMPGLILLDIKMPRMDGFEVCRRLREWSNIPVIMLTSLGNTSDIVKAFDLGADDYVLKPFKVEELGARIKSVLRRAGAVGAVPVQPSFSKGNLKIDFAGRLVTMAGREIKLTPTEYSLLQELALNSGKVLTHGQLLQKVWGPEYLDEKDYLHVFVGRLRAKLEPEAAAPKYLMTVPGVGYKFNDDI